MKHVENKKTDGHIEILIGHLNHLINDILPLWEVDVLFLYFQQSSTTLRHFYVLPFHLSFLLSTLLSIVYDAHFFLLPFYFA